MKFMLNGTPVEVRGQHPHLLAALREELNVTSPKDGCSPSGQCGCCTVMVDGKAVVSCNLAVSRVEGKTVTTVEGLPAATRDTWANAFGACGALQCGFCIPGIVMRAHAQVSRKGASLTRDDMARHLGAHLCRCTGYVKILDAIESVAQGQDLQPERPGGIGSRGQRYQARELTLGDRDYIDDLRIDGLAHAALHLTAHTRADVVAIDTTAAAAAPGVVAVFTAADVPGELRVGLIYKDWPILIPVGGRTSVAGDVLAIVVAESREEARAAAALVAVQYDVLTPVTDPLQALATNAPVAVWGTESNVLSVSSYRRGDVEHALATAVHSVHEVFETQRIEHAFLEPESTLARPVEGPDGEPSLYVYSGGQGVWDDRNDIARVLGLSKDRVTVELVSNGGAFGGKEDLSNQAQTALAAWLLRRPVKCTLSREESLLIHPKRHPTRLDYEAGCDGEGRLVGLRVRGVGDSGAYASVGMKVLERAAGHASGPYRLPSIDVETIAVRTNNPSCGAFRGFGANQAQFAMEGVLDRLAALVGISGWEIRRRNVIRPGEVWGPGQIMDDGCLGALECLEAVRPAYDEAVAAGKAVGVGLGLKNSGLGNGFKEWTGAVIRFRSPAPAAVEEDGVGAPSGQGITATGGVGAPAAVEEDGVGAPSGQSITATGGVGAPAAVEEDGVGAPSGQGIIEVRHGWTEMGQGMHTVALQVAVEELGVDPERIVVIVDTTRELGIGQTTGSRGALMGAGAIKAACEAALAGGCQPDVDYLGEYRVDWTNKLGEVENPTIHSTFGYAAQLVIMDRATGAIERIVAAHDVGRAINPTLCEGQVEGAVHMGLGYALTEDFPHDPATGFPTVMTLRGLGILRPKDVPPMEVILVESPQPNSPYGVKGVGEIGLVPTAGAVAAALHDRDGTWRNRLPMRPDTAA